MSHQLQGQKILALMTIILILPSLGSSFYFIVNLLLQNKTHQAKETSVQVKSPFVLSDKFNVYYLVPDGYARNDQLESILNFNNSQMTEFLKSQGFLIAEKSLANYPMTFLSLSTAFQMNYVMHEEDAQNDRSQYEKILSGHNEVVEYFKSIGYQYILAGNGYWKATSCSGYEDFCLRRESQIWYERWILENFQELEASLLKMTPLFPAWKRIENKLSAQNSFEDITFGIDTIESIHPRFVFGHITQPHPPYVYHANCEKRKRREGDLLLWGDEFKNHYVENLQCVNQQLQALIQKIISVDPDAIFIIQSDHGSAFTLNLPKWDWTETGYTERFGILTAIRAPERCRPWIQENMSQVNIFRFVKACLENKKPEYLPYESYIGDYQLPYRVKKYVPGVL